MTYSGARFDLPLLRRHFGLPLAQPHLDLCPVLHAWHLYGGLKATEAALGLRRRRSTGVDGLEAVRLWERYRRGHDPAALRQLLVYNAEDVLVLEMLLARTLAWSMRGCPLYRPSLPAATPTTLQTPLGPLAL